MSHSFTMGMKTEANNGQQSALKTHWLEMSVKFVLGIIIHQQRLNSDHFNVVHFANSHQMLLVHVCLEHIGPLFTAHYQYG